MAKHYITTFDTRQNMLRQNLEIFYYEDTNLQPVSSHRHEHYEVYFFLSGPVNCLIDDKNYPLAPGDICLIPPGIYHRPAFRNEKETYRRIVLWISADYLNQLKRTHSQIDYCFQLALNKNSIISGMIQGLLRFCLASCLICWKNIIRQEPFTNSFLPAIPVPFCCS